MDFVIGTKRREAHNPSMGKIRQRIRSWRLKRATPTTDVDVDKDWKTVGKTFRASDAVYDKSLPSSTKDEGRPPH